MVFAIVNCRVFDGSTRPVRETASVVIEDDRIKSIVDGRTDNLNVPIQYDGTGLTVLPGLIDMHVHFGHHPRLKRSSAPVSEVDITLNAVDNLSQALRSGITTVRDLGCGKDVSFGIKRAWYGKRFVGAKPYISGGMITATGGHGIVDKCFWCKVSVAKGKCKSRA